MHRWNQRQTERKKRLKIVWQTEEEERKEIKDESGSEIEKDRLRDGEKRKTLEREKDTFKPHKRN